MTDDLTLLRLVAIKGRVQPEILTASLDTDAHHVQAALDGLVERELVKSTPMGYRITPTGRELCSELVAAEHRDADGTVVSQIYEEFCDHNHELKAIVTDWQTKGPDEPNDHADPEYDEQVVNRLLALHNAAAPLADRIAAAAPRLGHYPLRLQRAARAVADGDHNYVSKPIIDSYHTVWFELHEDLIGLAGLTRAGEAEAGRGA